MPCHRGRNNRLDDQLAEPGFPDIDDHVMVLTGPSGKGRRALAGAPRRRWGPTPRHLGWWREMLDPRAGCGNHAPSPLHPCRSLTVPTPERLHTRKAAPPIHGAGDRIPAPPAHPGAGGNAKQRGDKMSTEQAQSSSTDASPEPGPAGGRASTGLLFCLLPLSSAAQGGLTVSGFFFVIAAAAFLSDRAGYGAALSVYGTVITLLPVSIVWAVLLWTRARLGPDSDVMPGIPTSWDRHWVGVTWWTAAMATGWIVIAVLVAGLPDLMSLGSRGGFPALFELLPAGLAALGATLYVAIASTAVLVIIVPISAGPGRQEPGRGLAKAVYTLFMVEVTAFIAAGVAKMGGNLLPAYGIS